MEEQDTQGGPKREEGKHQTDRPGAYWCQGAVSWTSSYSLASCEMEGKYLLSSTRGLEEPGGPTDGHLDGMDHPGGEGPGEDPGTSPHDQPGQLPWEGGLG